MRASRYLIRFFSSGFEKWVEQPPDDDSFKKVFRPTETEHSVYEVADGEEECLAAAAHKLNDPKSGPDAVSLLRMDEADLSQFRIRIQGDQFGTTGVPKWDGRHRNMLADREQILALWRYLMERLYRGHDQLRRINKSLVVRSLEAICRSPPTQCPDHVRQIAQWCKDAKNNPRPSFSAIEIKNEIRTIEFEASAIQPIAKAKSSGDQVADWLASVEELRSRYSDWYVPKICARLGIPG